MEIVAMDMKLRGMYIARQLSFTGVTFKIDEVPLTQEYINMYNKSVRLVSIYLFITLILPFVLALFLFQLCLLLLPVGECTGKVPAGCKPHGCRATHEEVHVGSVLVCPPKVL